MFIFSAKARGFFIKLPGLSAFKARYMPIARTLCKSLQLCVIADVCKRQLSRMRNVILREEAVAFSFLRLFCYPVLEGVAQAYLKQGNTWHVFREVACKQYSSDCTGVEVVAQT